MLQSGHGEDGNEEEDERAKVMTSVDKVVSEQHGKLDDLQKQFSDIEGVRFSSKMCFADFGIDSAFYILHSQ